MADPDGGTYRYCMDCISVVRNEMRRSNYLDRDPDPEVDHWGRSYGQRLEEAQQMLHPEDYDDEEVGRLQQRYS